jgi:preprotein translocase subunit SecG
VRIAANLAYQIYIFYHWKGGQAMFNHFDSLNTLWKRIYIIVAIVFIVLILSLCWVGKSEASPIQQNELNKPVIVSTIMNEFKSHDAVIFESILNTFNPALVAAVIGAESDYKRTAVSSAGCLGLMQIHPKHHVIKDWTDVRENIKVGSRFLEYLMNIFPTTELALAAYNAGPGAVRKYGGMPPYEETQHYVKRVLSIMKRAESSLTKKENNSLKKGLYTVVQKIRGGIYYGKDYQIDVREKSEVQKPKEIRIEPEPTSYVLDDRCGYYLPARNSNQRNC